MLKKGPEKFKHLDNIDPKVNNILKLPLDSIDNQHLGTLKNNLSKYSEHNNKEIAKAAKKVINDIENIMIFGIGDKRISSEIVNATVTADDYNNILAA